ncbi:MAG: hypothetical protein WKF75_12845, partial [Singulisphaera sp.]
MPPGVAAEEQGLKKGEDQAVFRVSVPADVAGAEFPARLVAVADEVRAAAPLRVAIEPSQATILMRRARGFFDGGKHDEALRLLDEAMALNPEDPSAYLL